MTRRSLEDLLAHAEELADQFESYEPRPEDRDAPLSPSHEVKMAAWRRAEAERELAAAVARAWAEHVSWRELGEMPGTSGKAARQRYASRGV